MVHTWVLVDVAYSVTAVLSNEAQVMRSIYVLTLQEVLRYEGQCCVGVQRGGQL